MEEQDDAVVHVRAESPGLTSPSTVAKVVAQWGVGLGCLLAGGAVAYHLLVYVPARDAKLTPIPPTVDVSVQADLAAAEAAAERARNDQIERQRVQAEESRRQEMRRAAYQTCLSDAEAAYLRRWAGQCRIVSEKRASDREDCIRRGPSIADYCINLYPDTPRTGCTLPRATADDFDQSWEAAKTRCLNEMNAGLF